MLLQQYLRLQAACILAIICLVAAQQPNFKPQQRSFNHLVKLGDYNYFLGLFQKVTWHQAAHICAFQGMSLLSIDTKAIYDNLRKHLSENGILDVEYWLSGNNLVDANEFYWLDNGQPFRTTFWAAEEPKISTDSRGCVHTLPTFEWALEDCASQHYFICSSLITPYCNMQGNCKRI